MKGVIPIIKRLDTYAMSHSNFQYLTVILGIFMIFNIGISCMAAERQKERVQNIMAENKMDIFLDRHYPDKMMNTVYANKIERIPAKQR